MRIELFEIDGLHNRVSYRIPIINNKLILVGENGTGKSTVVSILYLMITRQWHRLSGYDFKSIAITVNAERIETSKEQIDAFCEARRSRLNRLPTRVQDRLDAILDDARVTINENRIRDALRSASIELGVPYRILVDAVESRADESPSLLSHQVTRANDRLTVLMTERVLFLPTYRRIEQELNAIFRTGVTSEIKTFIDRAQEFRRGRHHIELVAFGMDDVVSSIDTKMGSIKEALRTELNTLTGSYLRDVILGRHDAVSYEHVEVIDETTLEAIFKRINDEILPTPEKERLREIIRGIHKQKSVSYSERVVAHFLTKLYEVHSKQTEKEIDIVAFVDVCNTYLVGKHLYYDDSQYTIKIHEGSAPKPDGIRSERTVELSALSSGEKQIVSLFSHIYLSDLGEYIAIIDEPELSLSMTWQKNLLPDILKTSRCHGILAVTHSPFIFENEFDGYAKSLTEFTFSE